MIHTLHAVGTASHMYLTRTSVPTLNSPDAVAVKLLAVTAARLAADPDYWSVNVTIGSTMVLYLSRSKF
jgi:hypothetical protein